MITSASGKVRLAVVVRVVSIGIDLLCTSLHHLFRYLCEIDRMKSIGFSCLGRLWSLKTHCISQSIQTVGMVARPLALCEISLLSLES
jgi:hypothetical protein